MDAQEDDFLSTQQYLASTQYRLDGMSSATWLLGFGGILLPKTELEAPGSVASFPFTSTARRFVSTPLRNRLASTGLGWGCVGIVTSISLRMIGALVTLGRRLEDGN